MSLFRYFQNDAIYPEINYLTGEKCLRTMKLLARCIFLQNYSACAVSKNTETVLFRTTPGLNLNTHWSVQI